jgi:hypothetical protein
MIVGRNDGVYRPIMVLCAVLVVCRCIRVRAFDLASMHFRLPHSPKDSQPTFAPLHPHFQL